MRHMNLRRGSAAARRFVLTSAVAIAATAAILGTAAMSSATPHSPQPATQATPATAAVKTTATKTTATRPATAKPAAAQPAAQPDTALARAFRTYFRHQAATGMTTWLRTGIEHRNQAILIQTRLDAFPHRDAALPADSAALLASPRDGLAHPSPQDTTGWKKLMRDEITIARELPVIREGNAATALAPVITQDYLTYTQATS